MTNWSPTPGAKDQKVHIQFGGIDQHEVERQSPDRPRNIEGAWVKEQKVLVEGGAVNGYRVDLKVSFVLD